MIDILLKVMNEFCTTLLLVQVPRKTCCRKEGRKEGRLRLRSLESLGSLRLLWVVGVVGVGGVV